MKLTAKGNSSSSQLIFYQTDDQQTRLEVRLEGETVWLTLNQMADLFQRDKSVISRHIRNVFEEGELPRERTVANFATVQSEGNREVSRDLEYFNLDVIISVGYRVKSHRGTQFRIWATQRLREYEVTQKFFATVQNKMHWAVHGQTAAEVIHHRADATKPNMGLTNWKSGRIRRDEVAIAKNYLTPEELEALNLIVSAYLDFAELQALNRRVMHMADWIAKLDDFLKLTDREILTHAGRISHEQALQKAEAEFERYRALKADEPSPVEKDFEEAVAKIKKLTGGRKSKKSPKKK